MAPAEPLACAQLGVFAGRQVERSVVRRIARALKILGLEARLQQEKRQWLEIHATIDPDQVHVHALGNVDLAVEDSLDMERSWWNGLSRYPKVFVNLIKSVQACFRVENIENCRGGRKRQVVTDAP